VGGRATAAVRRPAVPGGPPAPHAVCAGPSDLAPQARPSTLGAALALLGDSWTLLILQRAFRGVRRYADWRDELGISDSVLAGRLRDLTAGGVLVAAPYREGGRTRHEYRLSPRGLELWSLLITIWSWERRWIPRADPLPDLVHLGCGQRIDVTVVCGACGDPVTARDTVTTNMPGGTFAGVIPPRVHPRRSRKPLPSGPLSWFPGTVEVLGDRWSTCILGGALLGMRTFTQFQRELQVSPDVLSDRLRRFVDHGVLSSGPTGYRLTDRGRATFPLYATLTAWGDRAFAADGLAPGLRIVHRACGAVLDTRMACTGCGSVLERTDVRFAPARGPGPQP
jgi:DNA-binding HxlR family transcriptional regulator